MNFQFDWFLTLPGLFITGGVILLVIALIILLVTNRKSKKEKNPLEENTESSTNLATQNTMNPNLGMNGMDAQVNTMATTETVTPDVATPNSVNQDFVIPPATAPVDMNVSNEPQVVDPATVMAATANTDINTAIPVVPAPESNTITEAPVVDPIAVSNVTANVQPQVQPGPAPVETLTTEQAVSPVENAVNPTTIYGGANPTIPNVSVNNNSAHQIYGGANPLENTQNVPNTVPTTPVVNPVPTVEPIRPVAPTVQPVNPVPVGPSVQPVVEPVPSVSPTVAPTVTPNVPPTTMPNVAPTKPQPVQPQPFVQPQPAAPQPQPVVPTVLNQ